MDIVVSSRALLIKGNKLLLVKHVGTSFWTTPGGHLEKGETLHECVIRETNEETGLVITPHHLVYVFELKYKETGRDKIDCFFQCEAINDLDPNWQDLDGGVVQHSKYYSYDELSTINVAPLFLKNYLKEATFLKQQPNPYQGVTYR